MPNASSPPVIGIPCDVRVEARSLAFVFRNYVECVEQAGGLPLLIPPLASDAAIPQYLDHLNGVLFVGGEDIDPHEYGEEPLPTHLSVAAGRGAFDLAFARAALDRRLPVLGVCYGCQLLAVAAGGTLWQDIPSQVDGAQDHSGRFPDLPHHAIDVTPGSRLHTILRTDRADVNTAHHQSVRRAPAGWSVTARTDDGVIEAIERAADASFGLGVEWHPELMPEVPEQQRLFRALVVAAVGA